MNLRMKAMLAMELFSEIQAPLLRIYTNSINKFSSVSPNTLLLQNSQV